MSEVEGAVAGGADASSTDKTLQYPPSMRYRMLAIMTAAQAGASLIVWGYGSLAPFIVAALGIGKAQFGMLMSAQMVGITVAAVFAGIAVDRFGERRLTMFGGCAICVTVCIAAAVASYPALVVSLFFMGVVYATLGPSGGRALLTWFDRDRAFAMSIRQTGAVIGPALAGVVLPALAFHWDYRVALVGGALVALLGAGVLPILYVEPKARKRSTGQRGEYRAGLRLFFSDVRTMPIILTCSALTGAQLIGGTFITLTAVDLAHTSVAMAAALFTIMQLSAAAGRIASGWASDVIFRGDRMMPIAILCATAMIGAAGMVIADPANVPLLFVATIVFGFTSAGWAGLFITAIAEIGGMEFAGRALGVAMAINGLGGAIAPITFGLIADAFGLRFGWAAVAALLATGPIPLLIARRKYFRNLAQAARERVAHV